VFYLDFYVSILASKLLDTFQNFGGREEKGVVRVWREYPREACKFGYLDRFTKTRRPFTIDRVKEEIHN